MGLTKSLVFRLLATLEARGFVTRDADQAVYSLGHRVGVLGERAGAQNTPPGGRAPGDGAPARGGPPKTSTSSVREGRAVPRPRDSRGGGTRSASSRWPAAADRSTRAAARSSCWPSRPRAVRDEVLASPLPRFTDATLTDPAAIRERLGIIRRDGTNVSLNDLDEGAFSIAAPVRDAAGTVIAAISIAGASGPLRRRPPCPPPRDDRGGGGRDHGEARHRAPDLGRRACPNGPRTGHASFVETTFYLTKREGPVMT